MIEPLGLFLTIAGFIIGLGAVVVIDVHGFLARNSSYWTKTTVRAHKVTKPLIWVGTFLLAIGGVLFYLDKPFTTVRLIQVLLLLLLVLNGLFLTFKISPYLIEKENQGRSDELLPTSLQNKIKASFVFSVIGWWGEVGLFVWYLTQHLS